MKRKFAFASLIVAGLLFAQPASAIIRLPGGGVVSPPASSAGGGGGGGGSSLNGAGAYVFGATFCSAAFLWFRAYLVSRYQNRELTQGEAWETVGACFIPIIGGPIFRAFVERYRNAHAAR